MKINIVLLLVLICFFYLNFCFANNFIEIYDLIQDKNFKTLKKNIAIDTTSLKHLIDTNFIILSDSIINLKDYIDTNLYFIAIDTTSLKHYIDTKVNNIITDTAEWSKLTNIPNNLIFDTSFIFTQVLFNTDTDKIKSMVNYFDTAFIEIINSDTIFPDTSITAETQMNIVNDTSCFIINGASFGIDLTKYDWNYRIKVDNRYWVESACLIYFDELLNRLVFKADENIFPPNTIKIILKRVKQ